jgi:hypothetical protein
MEKAQDCQATTTAAWPYHKTDLHNDIYTRDDSGVRVYLVCAKTETIDELEKIMRAAFPHSRATLAGAFSSARLTMDKMKCRLVNITLHKEWLH